MCSRACWFFNARSPELIISKKKNHAQMGDRVDDLLERSISKSHRFRSIEDDPFVFNVVEKGKYKVFLRPKDFGGRAKEYHVPIALYMDWGI
jgi:hypothetical protein